MWLGKETSKNVFSMEKPTSHSSNALNVAVKDFTRLGFAICVMAPLLNAGCAETVDIAFLTLTFNTVSTV